MIGGSGLYDGPAGGLGVEPVRDARDGVGDVPPYRRRPVPSGAGYASTDGPDAVIGDGAGEVVMVERVHLAAPCGGDWTWSRPRLASRDLVRRARAANCPRP